MTAQDTQQAKVRPNAEWWFPEDWKIVLRALAFAASYGKPEDCPRWRIDGLIHRAERERDRSLGRLEEDEHSKAERSKRDRARYAKRKAEREQAVAS